MINVQYPLIMIDIITEYNSQIGFLRSKKYISANEPVFFGHFPSFKLWPGLQTIEGLRQSALLYLPVQKIENKDLLVGILQLQLQMKIDSHSINLISVDKIKELKTILK
jgi:3-hydroxymyristoyl/3-hydroxydecanoyl-(acyl carrier protein) dehydratase